MTVREVLLEMVNLTGFCKVEPSVGLLRYFRVAILVVSAFGRGGKWRVALVVFDNCVDMF